MIADTRPTLAAIRTPQEPLSARILRLQAEARSLAKEHVTALDTAMCEVERLGREIADGGDAYPAGIRDLARRMAEDTETKLMTIRAILGRGR